MLLSDDLREWQRSLDNSWTLQIPAEISAARIETILALLRQTAGIRGARLLEPAETAKLLEPWLGPAAATATLPVPRLVDVQVDVSHVDPLRPVGWWPGGGCAVRYGGRGRLAHSAEHGHHSQRAKRQCDE